MSCRGISSLRSEIPNLGRSIRKKMKYPYNISNIESVHKDPDDKSTYQMSRFILSLNSTDDTIRNLITELPERHSISFYDPIFPQFSDPGAYFDILKLNEIFYIKAGNHGWMTNWKEEYESIITKLFWDSYNTDKENNNDFTVSLYDHSIQITKETKNAFWKEYNKRTNEL